MRRSCRILREPRFLLCALAAFILMLALCGASLAEEAAETFPFAEDELGLSVEHYLDILNEEDCAGMASIYWPWVVDTTGRIEEPLGRYYMYFSTDHANATGGISLAYSDDLLSGWTFYGMIYVNEDSKGNRLETETPSVIWHEGQQKWIMYFHSANSYEGEAQTSWRLTSEDGIVWGDKTKLFDLDNKRLYGNLHNGYVMPFEYKGMYFAYCLMGGGNAGTTLNWSTDGGLTWVTDHRQLGRWSLEDGHYFSQNHGTIVRLLDEYWWLGMLTDFSSGAGEKDSKIALSHIADMRSLVGKPYLLREADDADFESSNIRSVSVLEKDDKLYVFYHCCVGGDPKDNSIGKDYFNCVVIERDMTTDDDSLPDDVIRIKEQPQDTTVKYGQELKISCLGKTTDILPVDYQWLYAKTGEPVEGATSRELIATDLVADGIGLFCCEISAPGMKPVRTRVAKVSVVPDIVFITQPEDIVITQGGTTRLTCVAESNMGGDVAYQWCYAKSGKALENGQTTQYDVPTDRPVGETRYRCNVTAGNTTVSSRVVTVFIEEPVEPTLDDGDGALGEIIITTQPDDAVIELETGGGIQCVATTTDGTEVTYQWRFGKSGGKVANQTGSEFLIPDDTEPGDYLYKCEVSAPGHQSVTSRIAAVTITPSTKPKLSITAQPVNASVTEGEITQRLETAAVCSDGSDVTYQWYVNTTNKASNGEAIAGETRSTFAIPPSLQAGAYYYYCVVGSPVAEEIKTKAAVVLVLVKTEGDAETPAVAEQPVATETVSMHADQAEGSLLIDDLYRRGRTLASLENYASFLTPYAYDSIVASSIGLQETMYQQQYHFTNAQESDGVYVGGFDSVPFIMNNGEYDTLVACELTLDGLWFSKAPSALSITFTDGTNSVTIYSDDKRASSTPTHTKYTANIAGVETSGRIAERHNIIAHPGVLYSPRFRLDKTHGEISLWVCDQMLQSVAVDGLSAMGEVRVELRFQAAGENDISMFIRQIGLRLDC